MKLIFSCWLGSAFCRKSSMSLSPKGALGAAQGGQGGPSPISRGALGTPKSPDRSPKGVSESPLGPPRDEKHRSGDEQCVFKIVKITLVFIAFLDRSLRQSVGNATAGVQNRRSANRSETLASFRRAVGGPGSPRRKPWGVPGGPLGVQGAIPGRQGVLRHCLGVLLWVPDIHWGG